MLQVLLDTLCDTELLQNVSKIVMAVTSLMFWLQQHNSSLRCKNSSLRYNGSKFVADYAELKLFDCDATDWQTLPIESLWSLWPTVQLSSWDTRSTGITRFTALFPGPPGWAGVRRELLDFMVQGEINRGRHTDHPAGRHSIRTNQCPPPPSPIFTGRMPFLSPNQQCQNTEGN